MYIKAFKFFVILSFIFLFGVNVHAVGLATFKIITDEENLTEGDTIKLSIYSTDKGVLNPDTTFFDIIYDTNVFQFISYEGIGNTKFDQNEKCMIVDWSDVGSSITPINNNQLIGTLTLKVNENENDNTNTSTIYYKTSYEQILNSGRISFRINKKDGNNNNENDSTTNVETKNNIKFTTNEIIFMYVVGVIAIVITINIIIKNRKALQ